MKTKLIAMISIISFFNISGLFAAGIWVKKTTFDEGRNNSESEITNDKTPESSREGLFMQRWVDANDTGFCMAAWAKIEKKSKISESDIYGNTSGQNVYHSYNWSEGNVPRTAFSLDWTEAFFVRNSGDCDNRSLFNNKGESVTSEVLNFCFMSGPDHIMNDYGVHITTIAENRENKIQKSPKGNYGFGKKPGSNEPYWINKPDKGKSWDASDGDIISFSVGMDNYRSNNIIARGYVSNANIHIMLKEKAKSSYASIFHELSGFDMNMDGDIPDTQAYLRQHDNIEDYEAYGKLSLVLHKAIDQSALSLKYPRKVADFLQQIHLRDNSQSLNENQVAESVTRYFEQFSYTFEEETKEQASYYLAWLLAEAAARPVNTSENITNTRISFENLIEKLENILNENAKQAIKNTNSTETQKELDENLAKVKGKLLYYYYELSNDLLFPAFKKPIDNDIETIILKKFENEKILYNLLNNQIKTESESDFYKKWLNFYFDRIAERVVFWLVIETNKDEFRNPKYWGGMHYKARSIRSGIWPIEIYLTRISEIKSF